MLIQEMDLRLDLGFVYALADLVPKAEVTEKTEVRCGGTAFDRKHEREGLRKCYKFCG